MKPIYILSSAVLALALASCSNEMEDADSGQTVPLRISTEIQLTRVGMDDTQFEDNDQIGLIVIKDNPNGTVQDFLSAVTSDNGKSWELSHEVLLNKTPASVIAYHPYQEVKDDQILTYDIASQTNYLYGNVSQSVNNENPVANIKFQHQLAKLGFNLCTGEDMNISKVSISGTGLPVSATYSLLTNTFEATAYGTIESKNLTPVDDTHLNAFFLVAPMGNQELTLSIECSEPQGMVYNGRLKLPNLSKGQNLSFAVTIKEGEVLAISEATIEGWGEAEELQETTIAYSKTDANGHDYIDLGLPSGLKWATCNVGANAPEEYGDYFAWGETSTKESYNWETYKWCNGSITTLTKYNSNSDYGIVDNKTVLDPEDDAAHVNWGGTWRMPTKEEFNELYNRCTWTWDSMNGHNGYKVTGTNGNSIFLPAAGSRYYTNLNDDNSIGNYWSSTENSNISGYAYFLDFRYIDRCCCSGNCCGQSVRPVTE